MPYSFRNRVKKASFYLNLSKILDKRPKIKNKLLKSAMLTWAFLTPKVHRVGRLCLFSSGIYFRADTVSKMGSLKNTFHIIWKKLHWNLWLSTCYVTRIRVLADKKRKTTRTASCVLNFVLRNTRYSSFFLIRKCNVGFVYKLWSVNDFLFKDRFDEVPLWKVVKNLIDVLTHSWGRSHG